MTAFMKTLGVTDIAHALGAAHGNGLEVLATILCRRQTARHAVRVW
jgi:hypothetical protein